jgi:hypothetical protein
MADPDDICDGVRHSECIAGEAGQICRYEDVNDTVFDEISCGVVSLRHVLQPVSPDSLGLTNVMYSGNSQMTHVPSRILCDTIRCVWRRAYASFSRLQVRQVLKSCVQQHRRTDLERPSQWNTKSSFTG